MRYVVGTALYSADFTPQLRWEKTNETILLMNIKNEGAAFTDESDYSNTINLNGSSSAPTFVTVKIASVPKDCSNINGVGIYHPNTFDRTIFLSTFSSSQKCSIEEQANNTSRSNISNMIPCVCFNCTCTSKHSITTTDRV